MFSVTRMAAKTLKKLNCNQKELLSASTGSKGSMTGSCHLSGWIVFRFLLFFFFFSGFFHMFRNFLSSLPNYLLPTDLPYVIITVQSRILFPINDNKLWKMTNASVFIKHKWPRLISHVHNANHNFASILLFQNIWDSILIPYY